MSSAATIDCPATNWRALAVSRAVDRARFIAARGQLREVLGSYAGVNAQEIAFEYTQYGKPMMAPGAAEAPLQFNVPHHAGWRSSAYRLPVDSVLVLRLSGR